ncbi:hypothetical protein F8R89_35675 [Streptomyces sp. SS1-1]|uniref:hypothetical protein n=1 Tax=Streptomyces sp. SS1-1 TaxID=2651869 RepID=UPI001250465D|nr:hypothetical protein [Streptomyces sp. SS1-1]KAB2976882.1 hypothetical protein F8R89_35675 [Streptomyces sp. SS1-1]
MNELEPFLRNVGTATWSMEDGIAFEVALNGIDSVVGAYTRLIAQARSADDTQKARDFAAQRGRWSARRRRITPADRATVDAVISESARLLEQLRAR